MRLPKAVYAYLELLSAKEEAAKTIGAVAAEVQFDDMLDRSWWALSDDEHDQIDRLLDKK